MHRRNVGVAKGADSPNWSQSGLRIYQLHILSSLKGEPLYTVHPMSPQPESRKCTRTFSLQLPPQLARTSSMLAMLLAYRNSLPIIRNSQLQPTCLATHREPDQARIAGTHQKQSLCSNIRATPTLTVTHASATRNEDHVTCGPIADPRLRGNTRRYE